MYLTMLNYHQIPALGIVQIAKCLSCPSPMLHVLGVKRFDQNLRLGLKARLYKLLYHLIEEFILQLVVAKS